MEQKCPHCGADLPENAAFCPHCARDIHGRKKPGRPVPLQKKLLLGLLVLAVVIAAGAGLRWFNRPYVPQEFDGVGEVYYESGDTTYQLLVAWPNDRTAPAADIYHQGAPDEQYRWPSRWYVNDALTGTDAWGEFEPLVEQVTVEVVQDENAADELIAGEPSHQEDYSPDAAMVSSLDFTGNSGEPQVVWTVQMKNGDLIRVRQNLHITPVITHEYHWEDYLMSTAEEVQSLLVDSALGSPRRTAAGIDAGRLSLLLAVLEKKARLRLSGKDVYINVVGDLRLDERGADLAVALCIASAFDDKPLPPHTAAIGELGLTGELRGVAQMETRLRECLRLGYTRVLVPKRARVPKLDGLTLIPVASVMEAVETVRYCP